MSSLVKISFGMGCFVFEVAPSYRGVAWQFEEWRSAVEEALLALPNVTNVSVTYDAAQLTATAWTPQAVKDEPARPELQFFEPDLRGAVISFDITIPKRLHADLLKPSRSYPGERFSVQTSYEFHGPVTFVACLDEVPDGSNAVVMLYRFLKSELPKHSDKISFDRLGPSPFHARGALTAAPGQATPLAWELVDRRGYSNYRFTYAPEQYDSIDDALSDLFSRLSDELSLYYLLVRLDNRANQYGRHLRQKAEDLVAKHQREGFRAAFNRVFFAAGPARDLGLDALDAKMKGAKGAIFAEESITNTYVQSPVLGCFEKELRGRVTVDDPAVDNVLEVVRFLEGGRSKELELAIIGTSTLLGGLAGAVAALIAS